MEKMPRRTYISKIEKVAPGFKARTTLLLCSNASGDFITKPLFINRSLNPRMSINPSYLFIGGQIARLGLQAVFFEIGF